METMPIATTDTVGIRQKKYILIVKLRVNGGLTRNNENSGYF